MCIFIYCFCLNKISLDLFIQKRRNGAILSCLFTKILRQTVAFESSTCNHCKLSLKSFQMHYILKYLGRQVGNVG